METVCCFQLTLGIMSTELSDQHVHAVLGSEGSRGTALVSTVFMAKWLSNYLDAITALDTAKYYIGLLKKGGVSSVLVLRLYLMKVSWVSGFLSAFLRDARRTAFSSPPDWTPRINSLT